VVYGEPALAAALERGITAQAVPGSSELRVPAWGLTVRPGKGSQLERAFAAIVEATGQAAATVTAEPEIPSAAGLGSSAALAAAVARALTQDPAAVEAAVTASERVFHGNPSGVDAAMALGGGFGLYRRGIGLERVKAEPFVLCVAYTGKKRDTSGLVARVASMYQSDPQAVGKILGSVGTIVRQAQEALVQHKTEELGKLMNWNQELLVRLGVSCEEIEAACKVALRSGALGAKLTGAGGGGCVIALAPGGEERVLAGWRAAGFECFSVRCGVQHGAS